VLRDINAFEKKFQVGEGTYGSVFVARDKSNNNVVALKRINTEQEENGFPITALREVKILKALKHPNIVQLQEIVCSKGAYQTKQNKNTVFGNVVKHPYCFDILFVSHCLILFAFCFPSKRRIATAWRTLSFTHSSSFIYFHE